MSRKSHLLFMLAILILLVQACNLPGNSEPTEVPTALPTEEPIAEPPPTEIQVVAHQVFPALAADSELFYDAESAGTASEKRAPYGDSYDINRLERPFLQDMTYVSDLDIRSFSITDDADWFYISIGLIGAETNNSLGINYGVEFDTNRDGFGDFVIVASPPYTKDWTTDQVRVFEDQNHNTGGISAVKSDAPFSADGYEVLIFDGAQPTNEDNDLAWARTAAGPNATVQFSIKRSLIGNIFMFGVFADGNLKDIAQLDYVDRFTEQEAGSPVKDKPYYPLQALFAVDNTCWEAFGFEATGYEPKICPPPLAPTKEAGPGPGPGPTEVLGCQPPPGGCALNGEWVGEPDCYCGPG